MVARNGWLYAGIGFLLISGSAAAHAQAIDNTKLQISLKLAYDSSLKTVIEAPANCKFNSWLNLGTDVTWSRSSQVYAGEFNFTPTSMLTITPTFYYDTKARGAFFVAWVPPRHDNMQFDIGYDKNKISVGVSTALNLAKLLR